jgi:hypothetical protein
MAYKAKVAVCFEICTKHSTPSKHHVEFFNVKPGVYSLNFADDQVLLAQDHDDVEYMARKLTEEYEK